MKWQNQEIKDLSDDDLWAAIQSVADVYNFRFDKLRDPRINKPKHRLNKIFSANPPVESEAFTKLCDELHLEWAKRNTLSTKAKVKSKSKIRNK